MTDAVRVVATTQDLLDLAHLAEIRVYEVGARATSSPLEEPRAPQFKIGYGEDFSGTRLENRFRFTVDTGDAEYLADIAAIFDLVEQVDVPEEVRIDFAERVGFMATFPYLRESVTTSSGRLGRRGPLVDLMRPGDFKIDRSNTQDASDDGR